MASRFENFSLGRRIAAFLKLKDPKNFPTDLHTDQLQPVVSIALPPNEVFVCRDNFFSGFDITGAFNTWTLNLIGDESTSPVIDNTNFKAFIEALEIKLQWDAAGGTAMAGAKIGVDLYYISPTGSGNRVLYSSIYNMGQPVGATAGYFRYNLGALSYADEAAGERRPPSPTAGRVPEIPANWAFQAVLYTSGPNWPVNTLLTCGMVAKLTEDMRGLLQHTSDLPS